MSKRSIKPEDSIAQRPLRTVAPDLLLPLHEVNERCLDLIALVAKLDPEDAPFAIVGPLRSLLRGTRSNVRHRAARQPFAFVDMEFRDADWWQAVKGRPSRVWKDRPWRALAPKRAAVQLAQTTLMLAWHMTRADPEATSIVFGMSREVAQLIGSLRLSEIDTIAQHQFRHVRPRWEERAELWRELLVAAHSEDAEAMRAIAIRALQFLAGEVVPRS
jgi:hypothetical protein